MTRFFSVSDNSFSTIGFPWIASIRKGLDLIAICKACGGRNIYRPHGALEAVLEPKKGTKWPDVLGCGEWPVFVVSERFISAWKQEGLGTLTHDKVRFVGPLPRKLIDTVPPQYYWIDGSKMRGALLDFEASGFVDVKFCPDCGTRSDNISATYDRQHSKIWPYVFHPRTWSGAHLFTTDISETFFFCTDKVVRVAAKHKFTNCRFIPVEEGHGIDSKGMPYM